MKAQRLWKFHFAGCNANEPVSKRFGKAMASKFTLSGNAQSICEAWFIAFGSALF